jgi:hypothetical protein
MNIGVCHPGQSGVATRVGAGAGTAILAIRAVTSSPTTSLRRPTYNGSDRDNAALLQQVGDYNMANNPTK